MTAKIKLNSASGGGSFSLQAPASSSNTRVITLPDVADGTLLTNQSSGLGKVIQLVHGAELATFSTSSTSYQDITGASINITPSSTSNKIFFIFSCYWVNTIVSSANVNCSFKSLRDSTNIYESFHSAESGTGGLQAKGTCNHIFIDSPSSTSALTYKVQTKVNNGSSTVYAYENRLIAFEVKV